jgi:hypothetical protein
MFLWTSKDKSNGARCLVAWDTCCQSKSHGGSKLSNLKVQNQCLLLKLLHRIHTLGDSSWVPWVHAHIDLVSMQGEVVGLKFEVCCSSIMHSPPLCLKMVAQPPSRTTFGLWPAVSQTHTQPYTTTAPTRKSQYTSCSPMAHSTNWSLASPELLKKNCRKSP